MEEEVQKLLAKGTIRKMESCPGQFISSLSDSQEGWILPSCGESEVTELVHYQDSLQNGRVQYAEGSVVGKQLDRFEGCVPLGGNEGRAQEVPLLCLGRIDVRISVPSICVEQCTKLLKPVVGLLREQRICLVIILDDMLVLAQSRENLAAQMDQIAQLFNLLVFSVNQEKSQLTGAQQI